MSETLHIVCPHCDAVNRVPPMKLSAGGRCGVCHKGLFTGEPVALDTSRFNRHLEHSDVPLLVDFWAPWCGPCRLMAPAFERAARELEPRMRLVKINVDEEPSLAARYSILGIPTTLLALRGRELGRLSGARTERDLVDWATRARQPA